MKLEHKKQKLAPVPKFAARVLKYNILAFLLVVFSILVGVIGYSYLGN
jgi:hypothetical protein